MLRSVLSWFHDLIHYPVRVFWICAALACAAVVLDGTALRLWSLHREHHLLLQRIVDARSRSRQMDFRIQKAQQPEFIERAARDQFDLVKTGDLVFLFPDDGSEAPEKTTEIAK